MYTMNKPCVIVRSFTENSIGLKRIKDIYSATVVARCIHNDCIAPLRCTVSCRSKVDTNG